jgi:putative endonuclease
VTFATPAELARKLQRDELDAALVSVVDMPSTPRLIVMTSAPSDGSPSPFGSTSNLEERISQHNDPQYTLTKTTKHFSGPWVLIYKEQFSTRTEALRREKQIKKRGIQRFLNNGS